VAVAVLSPKEFPQTLVIALRKATAVEVPAARATRFWLLFGMAVAVDVPAVTPSSPATPFRTAVAVEVPAVSPKIVVE
jgi:hypothetical protein